MAAVLGLGIFIAGGGWYLFSRSGNPSARRMALWPHWDPQDQQQALPSRIRLYTDYGGILLQCCLRVRRARQGRGRDQAIRSLWCDGTELRSAYALPARPQQRVTICSGASQLRQAAPWASSR